MQQIESEQPQLFLISDIEKAITECNFRKGVGPDAFDGLILEDQAVRHNVAHFLLKALNTQTIPEYLKEGRLVVLSKKKGKTIVSLEDTRPIVVNSHLQKILERTILNKLIETGSRLLQVGDYQ